MKSLFAALFCVSLAAQDGATGKIPLVGDYLGLSNAQTARILELRREQSDRVIADITRRNQVMAEIADETQKDDPDPAALGVRYRELELLCRDMRESAKRLRAESLAVLTEGQREKLKGLEEALRLWQTAKAAQEVNLIGSEGEEAAMSWYLGGAAGGVFGVSGSAAGCSQWLIRSGDFSSLFRR